MTVDWMKVRENARADIIRVLDDEDVWIHVVMNYVASMKKERMLRFRKNGKLDQRYNVSRVVARLNHAIGDIIDLTPPEEA